jgi:hypothetical protein
MPSVPLWTRSTSSLAKRWRWSGSRSLGVLGALTAVPLAATIQIFVQELTKARREKVAAAHAALDAQAKPA